MSTIFDSPDTGSGANVQDPFRVPYGAEEQFVVQQDAKFLMRYIETI